MSEETIKILADATPSKLQNSPITEDSKAAFFSELGGYWNDDSDETATSEQEQLPSANNSFSLQDVSVKKIEQEMTQFMKTVDKLFSNAELQAEMNSMELSEVELWVAITAEGCISLLGQGAKVAGTRSIALRFKKKQ